MLTQCQTDTRRSVSATSIQAELSTGLLAAEAVISPKFLYDALGSRLFEAICELPEYYPTRTEAAIFARYGADIARAIGPGATLIDLGAGNCAKAASLFPLLHPDQYVAIDISWDFLQQSLLSLRQRFPHIEMTALGQDFSSRLDLPADVSPARRLFFYPGSSIGNFTPDQALAFLRRARAQCDRDGGLLIGVDLIKDEQVLSDAYDDALGVTGAFNLNVLRHVNLLLGADFDVRGWRHKAFFNRDDSRIEMHLEAQRDMQVSWPGAARSFARGECIHTENSYKYRKSGVIGLLEQAGFQALHSWTDPDEWFAVIHARAIDA
ncbi:L-histidine N(alpha)-methyltransferase [Massilia soli]|uniref:L-histidine N(Alpha)-methyltransferase n=1 Tax=Massilia soli TaxID=2792854 RepID=A0ABS7SN68_9BURK|nr:L-histidine N(alpha)-methyltransferase [Massilia soli]MBZ2207245.1 L-histidine N(alpha)-methyltransferase [Massilia soli]